MIGHQLESYNDFVSTKLEHIIGGFNDVEILHKYNNEISDFKYKVSNLVLYLFFCIQICGRYHPKLAPIRRYNLPGFLDYYDYYYLDETMRPNHGQLSYQLQSIVSSANATAAVTGA